MVTGKQWTDRPLDPPKQPDRFWAQNLVLTTLAGQDATLRGRQWSDRPLDPPKQPDRFGSQSLVLTTLAGQDQFLSQPRQFSAPNPLPPQQPDRFQSQALVLSTLAGQDARVAGQLSSDLPQRAVQPDRFHSWSGQTSTLGIIQRPFNQFDWPLSSVPSQTAQGLPPNLVLTTLAGQDATVAGDQWTDRPIPAAQQPDRFWSQSLVLGPLAGQDATLPGQQAFALPQGAVPADRSWAQNLLATTLGQVALPHNQYDWPNPQVAGRIDETWLGSLVTTTLVGQDARLVGQQVFDRPPVGPSQFDLRSWKDDYAAIRLAAVQRPFNQFDWPLPLSGQRPADLGTWARSYNWALLGQDFLPFSQDDWPLPKSRPYPVDIRSLSVTSQFIPPATPVVTIAAPWSGFISNMGRMMVRRG